MDMAIRRKVIKLALPAIGSTLLLTLQMIVDTIMLGRYPPVEVSLTAMGLGSILYFMFFPMIMGLSTGTIAIVSRRWGEKKYHKANLVATDAFTTLILMSIPISIFGFFVGPHLLPLLGGEGMVITEGSKYIMAIFIFYPFNVFTITYTGLLSGAGDTKTPLYVNIIINGYNILTNYLLIFGTFGFPELGVLGAGIATGTSYLAGAIAYAILQCKNKLIIKPLFKRHFKTKMSTVKNIFKIGIPTGIEMGMWTISAFLITPIILHFGNVGYSAYIIGFRAESIAYMPAVGFGIAATTLSGQYLGAKKETMAKEAVLTATKLVMILMTFLGAILIILPTQIAGIFTSDTEVIGIATLYLILSGFAEPALGATFTLAGGLRGAGYTKVPMIINFIGLIIIRIVLLYVLAFVFGLGLTGIWIGINIEVFLRCFMIYFAFRRGSWMKVKV